MIQKGDSERYFWWIAITIFASLVILNYFPILKGDVPFPRDHVLRHAAWDGQPRTGPPQQVGQLIDIVAMFYPFRALAGRSVQSGSLPLWNPHISAGAPFEANAQSAVFGPLNLPYYVLPLKAAWTVNLVLRMFLAAIFTTMFTRAIGASRAAAIISGILFSCCGFVVQWQGESNGESCIWLPLICYAVDRLHRRPGSRSLAIAAFAFAAPVLAGHPETAFHATLLACALALFAAVTEFSEGSGRKQFIVAFAIAGTLAVGLAAIQIIPTLEWFRELRLHVESVQPVLDRHQGQGFFSRDILRDPSSAGVAIPEGSAYIGMLGLLTAPFALFFRPRQHVWFFLTTTVIAVAIAFGIEPIRSIVGVIPWIKAMKNGRMTLIADFGLVVLAGFGITVLEQKLNWLRIQMRRTTALLLLTFAGLSFCVFEVYRATLSPVEFWRSPWGSLVFLLLALLVIAARLRGMFKDRPFVIVTCGLAAVEMLTFSYGFLGFTPSHEVFPNAPLFDFLKAQAADAAPFRVAKDRVPIPHDAGMIYGFEAADGYDLTTERTRIFTADMTENRDDGVMFLAEKILGAQDRRFDMMNVKYLMVAMPSAQFDLIASDSQRFQQAFAQGSVAVFENKTVLPRAWAVPISGVEVIGDRASQLARLKEQSFDPHRSVVFSEAPLTSNTKRTDENDNPFIVEVVDRGINTVQLRTELSGPAVVVLSQMYYPGWQATVDGVEVAVHPVNFALTGIVLPGPGREIHLTFRPLTFRLGAAVSLLAAAIVVILLLRSRVSKTGQIYTRPSGSPGL